MANNQLIDKALAWIGNNLLVDYVTEQGTATHSTTGTWYYRKWNSGKIEAWNSYNIGSIPITTSGGVAYGGYRSDSINIYIPTSIFNGTPSGATISKNGSQGGWISNVSTFSNNVTTYLCSSGSVTLANQKLDTYVWKN